MDQTMTQDDLDQTIDATLDELMLGRGSIRRSYEKEDFIQLEFAAFADDDEVVETIRLNFSALAKRFGWKHCRVYREGAGVSVTLRPNGPHLFLSPSLPRRQPMLLAAE